MPEKKKKKPPFFGCKAHEKIKIKIPKTPPALWDSRQGNKGNPVTGKNVIVFLLSFFILLKKKKKKVVWASGYDSMPPEGSIKSGSHT